MPQKSKRQVNRSSTKVTSPAPTQEVQTPTFYTPRAERVSPTPSFEVENNYVRNDLRRIGILAGSLFAILILIYFLMPFIEPLFIR